MYIKAATEKKSSMLYWCSIKKPTANNPFEAENLKNAWFTLFPLEKKFRTKCYKSDSVSPGPRTKRIRNTSVLHSYQYRLRYTQITKRYHILAQTQKYRRVSHRASRSRHQRTRWGDGWVGSVAEHSNCKNKPPPTSSLRLHELTEAGFLSICNTYCTGPLADYACPSRSNRDTITIYLCGSIEDEK